MKKRAAGMAAISVLLCILIVLVARPLPPQEEEGSGEQQTETELVELVPEADELIAGTQKVVGVERSGGLRDTLAAASDYGTIFPYAARIEGWKADGTPVYRYAMADSGGEVITNAVYTSVTRVTCDDSYIWLMTTEGEDGTEQVACAASDGSWVLGPFAGDIQVEEDRIFVLRTDGDSSTAVYNANGKILGQIMGQYSSYTDGVIVSYEQRDTGTVWYFNDAEDIVQTGFVSAVHVSTFSEGVASAQLTETEWGFVSTSGEVTPVSAAWLDDTCAGYALAQGADGNYGVLLTDGTKATEQTYCKAAHCSEELPVYQLWTSEDECEVRNISTDQTLALPDDLDGQELVRLPGTYFSYTNEDGNIVVFDDLISLELEPYTTFYQQSDGTLIAVFEEGYQLIDMQDGSIGKLHEMNYVAPYVPAASEDSVFTVEDPETGRQGVANTRGRTVLPAEYDSIYSVDGSYYAAIQGCWSGIVDSNGDWIVRTMLAGTE